MASPNASIKFLKEFSVACDRMAGLDYRSDSSFSRTFCLSMISLSRVVGAFDELPKTEEASKPHNSLQRSILTTILGYLILSILFPGIISGLVSQLVLLCQLSSL